MNLVTALNMRLRGMPCRVHGSKLKVRVMDSIRYPDVFVTCGTMQMGSTVMLEPVVIFEVLSRSNARLDRMVKNREYTGTNSVRRYVMLEHRAMEGMMFTRAAEDGAWIGQMLGPEAILRMPEIGIDLPIADLYEGIDFASIDPDEADG